MRGWTRPIVLVLGLALFVAAVYPLAWTAVASVRTKRQIMNAPLNMAPPYTLDNYRGLLAEQDPAYGVPRLVLYYRNSLVVNALSLAVVVLLASAAGYAFARARFGGRGVLFGTVMVGMMIPVHATLIPLNRMVGALDLPLETLRLVGPYVAFAMPVSVFILRGFFAALPRELEEAAAIDGAGPMRTFVQVMLPNAMPAVATVLILNFVTMWNEYVLGLCLVDSPSDRTLPVGLVDLYTGQFGTADLGVMCAGVVLTVLPLLVVYLVAQRRIVKGLTAGALVGTGMEVG